MPKVKMTLTPREEYTAEDIRKEIGHGMLSTTEVGAYLGVHRHTAEKWLRDVDAVLVNGRRKYQAADIARKIEACRERAAV